MFLLLSRRITRLLLLLLRAFVPSQIVVLQTPGTLDALGSEVGDVAPEQKHISRRHLPGEAHEH